MYHSLLIDTDAILLAAYSPIDRSQVNSVYQKFIERTRYWRRDDYVLGDRLVAPFVISEINSNQNLHIRMLTSMLRHHTVLHHPIIGVEHKGKVLNWDALIDQGISFTKTASDLTAGRIGMVREGSEDHAYNPIGYTISAEKLLSDQKAGKSKAARDIRATENLKAIERRLV
jgi:multimeric flavodoxin WrbA